MPIDDYDKVLVEECALAIISGGRDRTPRLYPYVGTFILEKDSIIGFLTDCVELLTDGAMSIREADAALFSGPKRPPNLYLVLCAADTPRGTVTELDSDMQLIRYGPYFDSFAVDVDQASPDEIKSYRAFAAKVKQGRDEHDRPRDALGAYLTTN